jgi:hypothetical protein
MLVHHNHHNITDPLPPSMLVSANLHSYVSQCLLANENHYRLCMSGYDAPL